MRKIIIGMWTLVGSLWVISGKNALAVSYVVDNYNVPPVIECTKGEVNCGFRSAVIFKNAAGRTLYDTKMWTSGGLLEYTNESGVYVKRMTTFKQQFEVGEGPNVGVRVIVPKTRNVGNYVEKLYIDGKACNNAVSPPDCYYVGGAAFTVTIKVVEKPPVMMNCGWCGETCVNKTKDMACIDLAPPEGKSCVAVNNRCVVRDVLEVTPTTTCFNDGYVCGQGDPLTTSCDKCCNGAHQNSQRMMVCGSGVVINGDANGDGKVDLVDFAIWKRDYWKFIGIPITSFEYNGPWVADFNHDRRIDLSDFAIWKKYYLMGKQG
ncbi:MAG: dockerin type I repeat-containing protein [Microgenomates group bacterium]